MLEHEDANEMTMEQLNGHNIVPNSFKNSFSMAASRKQLKNDSMVGGGGGRSLMEQRYERQTKKQE